MTSIFDLKKPESLPKSLYWTTKYLNPQRFSSIGYQWKFAVETEGNTFLEIGPGGGVLTLLLEAKGLNVITCDINPVLEPSVCCAIPFLPFQNKSFDVVLCFEVLEHLPFSVFFQSLLEIKRLATKSVVISLPHYIPASPKNKKYSRSWLVNLLKSRISSILHSKKNDKNVSIPPEHFWEIGVQNISPETIIAHSERAGLLLKGNFRNPHNQYHHFFIFDIDSNESI